MGFKFNISGILFHFLFILLGFHGISPKAIINQPIGLALRIGLKDRLIKALGEAKRNEQNPMKKNINSIFFNFLILLGFHFITPKAIINQPVGLALRIGLKDRLIKALGEAKRNERNPMG